MYRESARLILCIEFQQEADVRLRFSQAIKHAADMCQRLPLGKAFARLHSLAQDGWTNATLSAIMGGNLADWDAGYFALRYNICNEEYLSFYNIIM